MPIYAAHTQLYEKEIFFFKIAVKHDDNKQKIDNKYDWWINLYRNKFIIGNYQLLFFYYTTIQITNISNAE